MICLVQFTNRLDLAFLFHPSVLKPDLDLTLGETELAGEFDATAARQIAVELEVFLQLQGLMAGVRLPALAPLRRVGA